MSVDRGRPEVSGIRSKRRDQPEADMANPRCPQYSGCLKVEGIFTDISVADVSQARRLYSEVLGPACADRPDNRVQCADGGSA
jgi:hypothetical protein